MMLPKDPHIHFYKEVKERQASKQEQRLTKLRWFGNTVAPILVVVLVLLIFLLTFNSSLHGAHIQ